MYIVLICNNNAYNDIFCSIYYKSNYNIYFTGMPQQKWWYKSSENSKIGQRVCEESVLYSETTNHLANNVIIF